MATTTSTEIPAPVQEFYNRTLLMRATPYLAHSLFGQKAPVPKMSGEQPKWRRYNSLTAATATLTEGVTPSSQSLSKTDVTGQLAQYGTFITISDYVQMTSQDKILTEVSELLGENLGNSIDQVYRDTLVAGTSVYRAGNVARGSIVSKLTAAELDKIIRALENNNAEYFRMKPLAGSTRVGTTPIAPAFFAIVDPYTAYDLDAVLDTAFIPVQKYPNPSEAVPNEIGAYRNLRFVSSTNAKVFADSGGSATAATLKYTTANTACDVHTALIFAKDSYGITPLTGHASEIIIKSLGSGDDALNQRSTAGWKATTDIKILNEAFLYRYEFGVAA